MTQHLNWTSYLVYLQGNVVTTFNKSVLDHGQDDIQIRTEFTGGATGDVILFYIVCFQLSDLPVPRHYFIIHCCIHIAMLFI